MSGQRRHESGAQKRKLQALNHERLSDLLKKTKKCTNIWSATTNSLASQAAAAATSTTQRNLLSMIRERHLQSAFPNVDRVLRTYVTFPVMPVGRDNFPNWELWVWELCKVFACVCGCLCKTKNKAVSRTCLSECGFYVNLKICITVMCRAVCLTPTRTKTTDKCKLNSRDRATHDRDDLHNRQQRPTHAALLLLR